MVDVVKYHVVQLPENIMIFMNKYLMIFVK